MLRKPLQYSKSYTCIGYIVNFNKEHIYTVLLEYEDKKYDNWWIWLDTSCKYSITYKICLI